MLIAVTSIVSMPVTTIGPIPLGLGSFELTAVSMLRVVGVPIDRLKTGTVVEMSPAAFTRLRDVPQGLVYRVMCSAAAGKARRQLSKASRGGTLFRSPP